MPFSPHFLSVDIGLHGYWYAGRAAGFVAYGVLFVSMAFGLAVSTRLFEGLLMRPWLYDLHRFVSLILIAVVLFHALVMIPDPYAGFTLEELLIPFRSHIRPLPTATGILTLYGLIAICISFYLTRWIGQRTWRAFHYLTFGLYVSASVHALWSGTDSHSILVRCLYLAFASFLLFLVFYRILAPRNQRTLQTGGIPNARRPDRLKEEPFGNAGRGL